MDDLHDLVATSYHFMVENDLEGKVDQLLSRGFIIFFKYKDEVFAAGEDSRITFVNMKHPDKDLPKNWEKEATFSACNLTREVSGQPTQSIFRKEDIDEIKIIDREEAEKMIRKEARRLGEKAFPSKPAPAGFSDLMRMINQNGVMSNEE